jgi:chromosome segregation ATPase
MSTAGKVLTVLIILAAMGWLILAGGVAQLDRNGNEALEKLEAALKQARADLAETQREIAQVHDQTSSDQEALDHQITTFRAQIADLEKGRSEILETLARLKYQKEIVDNTINAAKTQLQHRNDEHQAEEKAMSELRNEVQGLKAQNGQLMAQLHTLRGQFQKTHHANLELLQKKQ